MNAHIICCYCCCCIFLLFFHKPAKWIVEANSSRCFKCNRLEFRYHHWSNMVFKLYCADNFHLKKCEKESCNVIYEWIFFCGFLGALFELERSNHSFNDNVPRLNDSILYIWIWETICLKCHVFNLVSIKFRLCSNK